MLNKIKYYDRVAQSINLWSQKSPFLYKHVPNAGNSRRIAVSKTVEELLGYGVLNVFSVRGPCRRFIGDNDGRFQAVVA
jgi:hypothetical protein